MLLYIHIPFCDSKCYYCDFNSYVKLHHLHKQYIDVLLDELKQKIQKYKISKFDTVFIGGGTPSCIDAKLFGPVFKLIQGYISKQTEITIEANPSTATKNWLEFMKNMGVNRLSLGVQSLRDDKLKYLGRNHTKDIAIDTINAAKMVGFENINCDIIYNVKGDTKKNLTQDIEDILKLDIQHISLYSLTIEKGTIFSKKNEKSQNNKDKLVSNIMKSNFFFQYEVSAWAKKKSFICKHNLGYWKYKPYLGIGAGAVSCIKNERYKNKKNILKYLNNSQNVQSFETLSKEEIITEKTLLGLRSIVGCSIDIYNDKQKDYIYELIVANKLKINNNRIFAIDYMIADELSLYVLGSSF